MKTVLSNTWNKEIHEKIETNENNTFSSSGQNKSEGEEASASVGMKTVLSDPLNKEIHEQIETNESNKFSSSGENKSEEEEASKSQESREINTNRSNSNDKTKSGEYVLNRPPEKPGGGRSVGEQHSNNYVM